MNRSIVLGIFGVACVVASPIDLAVAKETTTALAPTIPLTLSSPLLQLNLEADRAAPRVTRLGWDTEGTNRANINLLKAPIELCMFKGVNRLNAPANAETPEADTVRYHFPISENAGITWGISVRSGSWRMELASFGEIAKSVDNLELVFPFEPTTAVTCVIADNWTADGKFALPAILSAPDLGQMLVTQSGQSKLMGRIEGSRSERWVTVTLDFPVASGGISSGLEFVPVVLPKPAGFPNEQQWKAARRGWFNLIQLSCGASGGGQEVKGIWSNNVLSDPVSSVLYMLVDATLLVPDLAPGVSMPPLLRRSVEYWIDRKTNEDGLVAYTAGGRAGREAASETEGDPSKNQNVMDSNPAVLIGAWGYVTASDDMEWLKARIKDLEFISGYMERRDIDEDGLIESKQSGNSGSRPPRNPDCAWDCYASGHKNAYVNAMAYRAWRGLAELERRLERPEQEQRYQEKANRLKVAFLPDFYNTETGGL